MKEELKKEISQSLTLIKKARKYTEPFNASKLFEICQDLIAKEAWLISYLLGAETKYREKMLALRVDSKSKADAELKAKASQEYKDYKYLQYVYNLIDEQIKLTKKFATILGEEKQNII